MELEIECYYSTVANNVVQKYQSTDQATRYAAVFKDGENVVNPSILVKTNTMPDYNYIHIPQLGRYYFVTDRIFVRAGLWELQLDVDVLQTYAELIYTLQALVDRQETDYNAMMIDTNIPIRQGYSIDYDEIENDVFDIYQTGTMDRSGDIPRYVIGGFALSAVG